MFSIASCEDTWDLFSRTEEEELLLFALTEVDCPRLPSRSAITVTYTDPGQELPQLLLDLRTSNSFQWKSAIILHDDTLSKYFLLKHQFFNTFTVILLSIGCIVSLPRW